MILCGQLKITYGCYGGQNIPCVEPEDLTHLLQQQSVGSNPETLKSPLHLLNIYLEDQFSYRKMSRFLRSCLPEHRF